MSKLQELKQKFLDELNERLPRGVMAQYHPSQNMPNVINVLISVQGMIVQAFALTEDVNKETGECTVWYCINYSGGFY